MSKSRRVASNSDVTELLTAQHKELMDCFMTNLAADSANWQEAKTRADTHRQVLASTKTIAESVKTTAEAINSQANKLEAKTDDLAKKFEEFEGSVNRQLKALQVTTDSIYVLVSASVVLDEKLYSWGRGTAATVGVCMIWMHVLYSMKASDYDAAKREVRLQCIRPESAS